MLIALAATRGRRRTVVDVNRRELLTVVAAGGAALAGASGGRVGTVDVGIALDRMAQLRRLDDSLGGADTFGLYLAEVEATEAVLSGATYTTDTRRTLLAVLAEQAQLAGWAAFDAGWTDRSLRLYQTSRQAAVEAGDQALVANALALDAYQRAFTGQVDVELARASCQALTARVPARVRALVFDRAAWSFAVAGLVAEAEEALSSAAGALDDAGAPADPDWATWVDAQEIAIMTGRCWSALGRPLRAVPPLTSALADFPEAYARDKALYLLALAEAYLHGREIELAAATITRAHRLTVGVSSTRPKARMAATLALSAPFEGTPAMRELRDRLAVSPQ